MRSKKAGASSDNRNRLRGGGHVGAYLVCHDDVCQQKQGRRHPKPPGAQARSLRSHGKGHRHIDPARPAWLCARTIQAPRGCEIESLASRALHHADGANAAIRVEIHPIEARARRSGTARFIRIDRHRLCRKERPKRLRHYPKAAADFEKLAQLQPRDASALNNLAWLRATCPDETVRDGKSAVADTTRACELRKWKDPHLIDTLAAALAEAGQFERAVEMQTRAIRIAPLLARNDMHQRLKLYGERKEFRSDAKKL